MKIVHTLSDLQTSLSTAQHRVLVPTMGNLHEGHMRLIDAAQGHNHQVMASIFVNRLQFAPHEDFDSYPRTLERDCEMLQARGCDLVFAPLEKELYPEPQTFKVHPDPVLADVLEGQFRPGFFTGVCTVVIKLMNCMRPDVAVFGQKDYQQWRIMERLVKQLSMPTTILSVPICRAEDGLALSSRNGYLSTEERTRAAQLSSALRRLAQLASTQPAQLAQHEQEAAQQLTEGGWQVDYICVRQRTDLKPPTCGTSLEGQSVALAAARLGRTRLIDNVEF
jgi:pantoate--beta-alanine ligase